MSANVDLMYNGRYRVSIVAEELKTLSKAHTILGNDKHAEDLYEMALTLIKANADIKKAFTSELNRGLDDAKSISASLLDSAIKSGIKFGKKE